jgi:hypothetical protein
MSPYKDQKPSYILPKYNGTEKIILFQKGGPGELNGRIRHKQDQNPTGRILNPIAPYPASGA